MDRKPAFIYGIVSALVAFLTTPLTVTLSDTVAGYIPAWQLFHHGTIRVPLSTIPPGSHALNEFHLVHGAYVSDRMPGVIGAMVPFSFLSSPTLLSSLIPSCLCLLATVYLVGRLWGQHAALVAIFATPILYMDRQLWPQTIIMPLLLLCLYRPRWIIPAMAYIFLCRPPTAIFAIGVIALYFPHNDGYVFRASILKPIIRTVVGTVLGAVLLLIYTHHYFGLWSLAGGYAVDGHERVSFLHSVMVGTVSPQRGLLIYTPWILAAFLVRSWRPVILLGALYTLAEWWQYNAFGGDGYLGFRYPLPFVLLCIGAVCTKPIPRVVEWLIFWSVGVNVYVAFHDHYQFHNPTRDAWNYPADMLYWGAIYAVVVPITMRVMERRHARH